MAPEDLTAGLPGATLWGFTVSGSRLFAGTIHRPISFPFPFSATSPLCHWARVVATTLVATSISFSQTHWTKSPMNPVLQLGPPGSWESSQVFFQSVVRATVGGDSLYVMFYSGDDDTKFRTGRAVSLDGETWEKDSLNPVLDAGSDTSDWNYWGSWVPRVIWDGSQYMMWYNGAGGPSRFFPPTWQMGVARSQDGRSWVTDSTNPLDQRALHSWWTDGAGVGSVLFDGTTYRTWYEGYNSAIPEGYGAIGLATSADGNHWTRSLSDPVLTPGSPGQWDDKAIGYGDPVVYDSGVYLMWYTGNPTLDLYTAGIGLAVSPDGIHWKKYPRNPILSDSAPGSWEEDVFCPSVILDGSVFRMWYSGVGPMGPQIGYATSPKNLATIELSTSSVDFQNVRPGTVSDTLFVTVSNWGFTPLTITEISHQGTAFSLPGLAPLPLTISPFDTVDIPLACTPDQTGITVNDTIVIESNDTQHPRSTIALRGRGKGAILPAQPETMYAVRLSQLYTIDRSHGSAAWGARLSPAPPPEMQSLAFRLLDRGLYGGYSTPAQTLVYRVSSVNGDLDSVARIPLGDVTAMAFSRDDSLYLADAHRNLFVMEGITGSPALVGTIDIQVSSLAFHPTTHELWGSARDTLCKINTATGETRIVGAGLPGTAHSSITFSPYGTLYGLYDNALVVVSDVIRGGATVIGATNVEGLQAIAMRDDIVADVLIDGQSPAEARLFQNYPNPFNPNTTIEYAIPHAGFVTLKIYSTLGQEVATLVSEEHGAGRFHAVWDAAGFPSGVYFCRLSAGGYVETRKLVLTK